MLEAHAMKLAAGDVLCRRRRPIIQIGHHRPEALSLQLQAELASAAAAVERGSDEGWFRLPIDRAFVVQGHGTVVTGSVSSGSVRVGAELDWHKGDGTVETIRVRAA